MISSRFMLFPTLNNKKIGVKKKSVRLSVRPSHLVYWLNGNIQPRWLSGLRRSLDHSLMIARHCVLGNWDRISVRAVRGLISRAGMVSICPLLWQRDLNSNKLVEWEVVFLQIVDIGTVGIYIHYILYSLVMAPKGGHIVTSMSVRPSFRLFIRSSVRPSVRHILFLLTGSSLCSLLLRNYVTAWPISPIMTPINWGNNVDVQRALHFDLDPFMTAGQGHEILRFCELFFLTGSTLCSLLLRNYSTDFSNDDTNQLREQCRCAPCTLFWFWPLHDCRSRSRNTLGI